MGCPVLMANGETIPQVDKLTYVGDILTDSVNNDKNIENRVNKGIGSVSETVATLRQISLGHFHFEIALIFRESLILSRILFSCEIWYKITKAQIRKLSEVD